MHHFVLLILNLLLFFSEVFYTKVPLPTAVLVAEKPNTIWKYHNPEIVIIGETQSILYVQSQVYGYMNKNVRIYFAINIYAEHIVGLKFYIQINKTYFSYSMKINLSFLFWLYTIVFYFQVDIICQLIYCYFSIINFFDF